MVQVLWRSSLTPFAKPSLSNFMTVHSRWVDMKYVLENDFVTLHGSDEKRVWFCVTDKDVDVYLQSTGPFVFVNQYLLAKKLIIVNWGQIHMMAGINDVLISF